MSVDPVTAYSNPIGSFNRYAYANNNPYRFTDPDGRQSKGLESSLCRTAGNPCTITSGESGTTETYDKNADAKAMFKWFGGPVLASGAYLADGENWSALFEASGLLPFLKLGKGLALFEAVGEANLAARGVRQLAAPAMHDHHLFPQQFKSFFGARGIDIDAHTVTLGEMSHLSGVHGKGLGNMPGRWNQQWAAWIEKNPNASAKEIYQQLGFMMDRYKINDLPIHPYKK